MFKFLFPKYRVDSAAVVCAGLLLSGCTPPGLYYWGDYESSLSERYVQNDNSQAEAMLSRTLQEAQTKNLRVPPGVNADYGFVLYRKGDRAGAVKYFEVEKRLYPESTALMSKLIDKVNQQAAAATAQPESGQGDVKP